MELNKYDLVDFLVYNLKLAYNLKGLLCHSCPIKKECIKEKHVKYICFDVDETRELLIKKYNL